MPSPDPPPPSSAATSVELRPLRVRARPWRAWVRLGLLAAVAAGVYVGWQTSVGVRATFDAQAERLAQTETAFESVPLLTDAEIGQLRRSRNARHVDLARQLGIEPVDRAAALDSAARADGLVRVGETDGYVALDGSHSDPFLTPAAAASLDSIAARFHAGLDTLGVPPYRFTVSSVLRSAEDQADLRGVNANAAAGRSSHEYATTYDITYRRYTPSLALAPPPPPVDARVPAPLRGAVAATLAERHREALDRFAAEYPSRLEAALGRALIALEDDGVLVTVRERRQPVYHTTVARDLPAAP